MDKQRRSKRRGPVRSKAKTARDLRHVDEKLFFRTRVEVAMKAHHLSTDEAVDYILTRINITGIGCIDDSIALEWQANTGRI